MFQAKQECLQKIFYLKTHWINKTASYVNVVMGPGMERRNQKGVNQIQEQADCQTQKRHVNESSDRLAQHEQ